MLTATARPAQNTFALLNRSPKSTERPKASKHLNATKSLSLVISINQPSVVFFHVGQFFCRFFNWVRVVFLIYAGGSSGCRLAVGKFHAEKEEERRKIVLVDWKGYLNGFEWGLFYLFQVQWRNCFDVGSRVGSVFG